ISSMSLPARGLRQLVDDDHVLRSFVAGQVLPAVLDDDVAGESGSRLRYHGRGHGFDPARMREAEHLSRGPIGGLLYGVLDVTARHVLTAGLDHVLLAVDRGQAALG